MLDVVQHSARAASGIYAIVHLPTRRAYIGSTIKMQHRRRTHELLLNRGNHHSRRLQSAWHDPREFAFVVLEECPKEQLLERERVWAAAWGTDLLNDQLHPQRRVWTSEQSARMSASRVGKGKAPKNPEHRARIGSGLKASSNFANYITRIRAVANTQCAFCGTPLHRKPSRLAKHDRHFCNGTCRNRFYVTPERARNMRKRVRPESMRRAALAMWDKVADRVEFVGRRAEAIAKAKAARKGR